MTKVIYQNKKQNRFFNAPQKTKTWIGGRGSGKTVNVGDHVHRYIYELPGMKGFLLGKTFGQVYDKFLPEVLNRLKDYGLKEHIDKKQPGHFVVCKRPPKYFTQPKKMPRRYDTSVFFYTGFFLELLSFDRPDLARGGSYDVGIHDEASLLKKQAYNRAIRPLVRGKSSKRDSPLRFQKLFYTSRSWTSWGKWVENDFKKYAADFPNDYCYMETSALDNKDILGEKYFKDLELELSPKEYDIEILNKANNGIPDGYYPYLNDDIHLYDVDTNDYEIRNGVWQKVKDGDVDTAKAIEPSFDFNAKFTSATIFQDNREERNELTVLNNLWVKYQNIESLVDKICEYYKDHPTKIANIYGGKDGETTRILISELDYYGIIIKRFKYHKWDAFLMADLTWSDKQHKIKFDIMNSVLKENDPFLPVIRFNMERAKHTYQSMANAPVKGNHKKDKSSEEDEDLAQEFATHLSDNVDNYVIPKVKGNVLESEHSSEMEVRTG